MLKSITLLLCAYLTAAVGVCASGQDTTVSWSLSTPGGHKLSGSIDFHSKKRECLLRTTSRGEPQSLLLEKIRRWRYYLGYILLEAADGYYLFSEPDGELSSLDGDEDLAIEYTNKRVGSDTTSAWISSDNGWSLSSGWGLISQKIAGFWCNKALAGLTPAKRNALSKTMNIDARLLPRRYMVQQVNLHEDAFRFDQAVTPWIIAGQYDVNTMRLRLIEKIRGIHSGPMRDDPFIREVMRWVESEDSQTTSSMPYNEKFVRMIGIAAADKIIGSLP